MAVSGCSDSTIEHTHIKLSNLVCENNGGVSKITSKNFLDVTYDVRVECNNGAVFKLSNPKSSKNQKQ